MAEEVHLNPVHVVVAADLLDDREHLLPHRRLGVVHLRPGAIRWPVVRTADKALRVRLLPGREVLGIAGVVLIVHPLRPEDLLIVPMAPLHHDLQQICALLDQRGEHVVREAALRAQKALGDLRVVAVARERAAVRAVEDRVHMRVLEAHRARSQHRLRGRSFRRDDRIAAIVVEDDPAPAPEHLRANLLEGVILLRVWLRHEANYSRDQHQHGGPAHMEHLLDGRAMRPFCDSGHSTPPPIAPRGRNVSFAGE